MSLWSGQHRGRSLQLIQAPSLSEHKQHHRLAFVRQNLSSAHKCPAAVAHVWYRRRAFRRRLEGSCPLEMGIPSGFPRRGEEA
ncbi:unnamed protein product [Knipowitschia caucasica]|uniref:Uncharacterized protein n=1 Tax=Knipowitschia caucasica TaxID=637954 RepID=A0AAV2JQL0_KNICA